MTAVASADQLTGEHKSLYTSMAAAGLGLVATVISLVVATNQDILNNKPLTVGLVVILSLSLIGSIALPIITAIDKGKLTRQRSRQWHENRLLVREMADAEAERKHERDLALIKSGKIEECFIAHGTVKIGDEEVTIYRKRT